MKGDDIVCYCSGVGRQAILSALDQGAKTLQDVRERTGACTLGQCRERSPRKRCCSKEILEMIHEHARTSRPRVAFVCVHNSCRSQIAEALGRHLAADVFESFSAGTEIKPHINPDAVRMMKEIYGIDMEQTQSSKLLDSLPGVNIVVKMGCEVGCPFLSGQHVEDWGLDDPTGKGDEAFRRTIQTIHDKVLALKERIGSGIIPFTGQG